jgi:glycosyltransferase involved in cell wall biosynthesis
MSIAVVTYLYPQAILYLPQLIRSINNQEHTSFSLIVFNDGVNDLQPFFFQSKVQPTIYDVNGTPTEIRIYSLSVLKNLPFDNYVFIDADDQMTPNRVKCLASYLQKHPLVVNDLSLSNNEGAIVAPATWANRIANRFMFNEDFIKKKNIVGFGNTAIRRTVLSTNVNYHSVIASDWYIFYQLIAKGDFQVIFTSDCQTIYRQHENNVAGIREVDGNRIKYVIEVKKAHYEALIKEGYELTIEYNEMLEFEQNTSKKNLNKLSLHESLFWWEETELKYE